MLYTKNDMGKISNRKKKLNLRASSANDSSLTSSKGMICCLLY